MTSHGGDEGQKPNKKHNMSKKKIEKKKKRLQTSNLDGGDKAEAAAKEKAAQIQRNRKGMGVKSVKKMQKQFTRTQDIQTKRHKMPVIDRNAVSVEAPPVVVAVVGAPKVGKTTLIKCLLRKFTSLKLVSIKGPVTVVVNKKTKLTIIECNNDICSMIDVAKVADLVLLLIDASFGFEMETFEFLSVCHVHGMPRIIGILTHIDVMRQNKSLKNNKKMLKKRFWEEVYEGAKLFYFTKFVNGEYLKREVHNLARFVTVMKFNRPITWRNTHSYLLADRMEDMTRAERIRENPKCDRTVCLYGYARGSPVQPHQDIHIPGCGDFKMSDVSFLPDPCPLPQVIKKRVLNQKEHLVYSPFSGVGGIVYDKDAVYIELGGSHSHRQLNPDELSSEEARNRSFRFKELMGEKETLEEKLKKSQLALFDNSKPVESQDFEAVNENSEEGESDEDEDDIEDSGNESENSEMDDGSENDSQDLNRADSNVPGSDGRIRRRLIETNEAEAGNWNSEDGSDDHEDNELQNSESENDDEYEDMPAEGTPREEKASQSDDGSSSDNSIDDDGALNWKRNLKQLASEKYIDRVKRSGRLRQIIYAEAVDHPKESEGDDDSNVVGSLFTIRNAIDDASGVNAVDVTLPSSGQQKRKKILSWLHKSRKSSIRNCFITGDFGKEDAEKLLAADDAAHAADIEDLEKLSEDENDGDETKEDNEKEDDNIISGETQAEIRKRNYEKKKKQMRKVTDSEGREQDTYFEELKSEVSAQQVLNREEFDNLDPKMRVQFEGYRAGMYLRIELKGMPCEFVENFDPNFPVVVGGLGPSENTVGYLNLRIRKHKWHRKILKSNDPVVVSIGWRRYQTLSTYSMQDDNMRNRFLKYTPEYLHCQSTIFGPIVPQGTGCLMVNNIDRATPHFRITATGSVLDLDKSTNIVKKLKLIGHCHTIKRKTAFVTGMFNSEIEVSKFVGANIRTVSGIKGQIKKPLKEPEGAFRATFADKILKSDVIFLRSWYPVDLPQLYLPVFNLLNSSGNREQFDYGMKKTGQVRYERGLTVPSNPDSVYHNLPERLPVKHRPLDLSANLQKSLPFHVKPKFMTQPKQKKLVVKEPRERKMAALLNEIRGVHADRKREHEKQKEAKLALRKKQLERIEQRKEQRNKELRKKLYRTMGRGSAPS